MTISNLGSYDSNFDDIMDILTDYFLSIFLILLLNTNVYIYIHLYIIPLKYILQSGCFLLHKSFEENVLIELPLDKWKQSTDAKIIVVDKFRDGEILLYDSV